MSAWTISDMRSLRGFAWSDTHHVHAMGFEGFMLDNDNIGARVAA